MNRKLLTMAAVAILGLVIAAPSFAGASYLCKALRAQEGGIIQAIASEKFANGNGGQDPLTELRALKNACGAAREHKCKNWPWTKEFQDTKNFCLSVGLVRKSYVVRVEDLECGTFTIDRWVDGVPQWTDLDECAP